MSAPDNIVWTVRHDHRTGCSIDASDRGKNTGEGRCAVQVSSVLSAFAQPMRNSYLRSMSHFRAWRGGRPLVRGRLLAEVNFPTIFNDINLKLG